MYSVIIAEQADQDLVDIAEYIALDNPSRAITFTEELLEAALEQLSQFPDTGKHYSSKHKCLPYKDYLIFYAIDYQQKRVGIVHITHAAQYTTYKDL